MSLSPTLIVTFGFPWVASCLLGIGTVSVKAKSSSVSFLESILTLSYPIIIVESRVKSVKNLVKYASFLNFFMLRQGTEWVLFLPHPLPSLLHTEQVCNGLASAEFSMSKSH